MNSIPLKLLHESKGHVVSIELKSGDMYRGHLMLVEDTMNCLLETVKITTKDGQLHAVDQAYIRGAQVRWVVVPDVLRHAPFLKKDVQVQPKQQQGKQQVKQPQAKQQTKPRKMQQ